MGDSSNDRVVVYGSYGYTGTLIVREAIEKGLSVVLAGRDAEALRHQAAPLGVPYVVARVGDRPALRRTLDGCRAVIHCAGPFTQTSQPMLQACLDAGCHYLDITGEIGVFEALQQQHARAVAAGIAVIPGVGFDVVPTDCLAAWLCRRVPNPQRLRLAFKAFGGASRGTLRTTIDALSRGGMVRSDGLLRQVPIAWKTRLIDFGDGQERTCIPVPWGDVSTAYFSTGVGNVEVYMPAKRRSVRLLRTVRPLLRLLRFETVADVCVAGIERMAPPPAKGNDGRAGAIVWGEVSDVHDEPLMRARLTVPAAYPLTAKTAVMATQRVLNGTIRAGFSTPSMAFGADFIFDVEGSTLDVLPGTTYPSTAAQTRSPMAS